MHKTKTNISNKLQFHFSCSRDEFNKLINFSNDQSFTINQSAKPIIESIQDSIWGYQKKGRKHWVKSVTTSNTSISQGLRYDRINHHVLNVILVHFSICLKEKETNINQLYTFLNAIHFDESHSRRKIRKALREVNTFLDALFYNTTLEDFGLRFNKEWKLVPLEEIHAEEETKESKESEENTETEQIQSESNLLEQIKPEQKTEPVNAQSSKKERKKILYYIFKPLEDWNLSDFFRLDILIILVGVFIFNVYIPPHPAPLPIQSPMKWRSTGPVISQKFTPNILIIGSLEETEKEYDIGYKLYKRYIDYQRKKGSKSYNLEYLSPDNLLGVLDQPLKVQFLVDSISDAHSADVVISGFKNDNNVISYYATFYTRKIHSSHIETESGLGGWLAPAYNLIPQQFGGTVDSIDIREVPLYYQEVMRTAMSDTTTYKPVYKSDTARYRESILVFRIHDVQYGEE